MMEVRASGSITHPHLKHDSTFLITVWGLMDSVMLPLLGLDMAVSISGLSISNSVCYCVLIKNDKSTTCIFVLLNIIQ